jgi:hypothetical protein
MMLVYAWLLQTTFYADIWQEAGGQLRPDELAALQRWCNATAIDTQHAGEAGPWVTTEDLRKCGLIDNPYHVQVCLSPCLSPCKGCKQRRWTAMYSKLQGLDIASYIAYLETQIGAWH